MSLTEAAEQALEALEIGYNIEHTLPGNKSCSCSQCKFVRLRTPAITSLHTALAEDAMQRLTGVQQYMERKPLTNDEIVKIERSLRQFYKRLSFHKITRAIERAHGIWGEE